MAATDDEIRDTILRHLLEVHENSKSPRSAAVGIRDLQSALKRKAGYKQQEASSNLDYLVQKGWVREVREDRSYTTARGTVQPAERITYKISDVGIDLLKGGASLYQRPPTASQINIKTVSGVTIVGNGNIVNTHAASLSELLDQLRREVVESEDLSDEVKLNVAADIDTIQGQLQKPEPDKNILRMAWAGIKAAVTVGGAADLVMKAAEWIEPLTE